MAKALICDNCGKTYPHRQPAEKEDSKWNSVVVQPAYTVIYGVKRAGPEGGLVDWCPGCVAEEVQKTTKNNN